MKDLVGVQELDETAFSSFGDDRKRWLSQLKPLVLNRNELGSMRKIGSGDWSRIFQTTFQGHEVAIKILRPDALKKGYDALAEFAGLMICNQFFPKVFPKPHGVLLNLRGQPFALVMEKVDAIPIVQCFDQKLYEESGVVKLRDGLNPIPESFFTKLTHVIKELAKHNVFLDDWNGGKIMIGPNGELHIIDIQYSVGDIENWERIDPDYVVDQLRAIFDANPTGPS